MGSGEKKPVDKADFQVAERRLSAVRRDSEAPRDVERIIPFNGSGPTRLQDAAPAFGPPGALF